MYQNCFWLSHITCVVLWCMGLGIELQLSCYLFCCQKIANIHNKTVPPPHPALDPEVYLAESSLLQWLRWIAVKSYLVVYLAWAITWGSWKYHPLLDISISTYWTSEELCTVFFVVCLFCHCVLAYFTHNFYDYLTGTGTTLMNMGRYVTKI